ncbi:chaperone protein dnaJ 11, chloroplastic-like [Rutidosis leptorrhynchoides]|uniref:chaperone protein dnaJ 11, chloroplastic-like n=1 Tax=Rutidosis leptorrhynchoides TaxID=125765 RepID=UPI003A99D5F0
MIGTSTTSITGTTFQLPQIKSTSKLNSSKVISCHAVLNTSTSLYEVLRVKRNATPIEIKTAYRNLAKVYHPDTCELKQHGGDQRDFVEIHNAYVTLYDPESRAMYDRNWNFKLRGLYTVAGSRQRCRRWETDQCW